MLTGGALTHLVLKSSTTLIPRDVWTHRAAAHKQEMLQLMYPHKQGAGIRERVHAVAAHPIYNFLHRYYRYSVSDLLAYSPGSGIRLANVESADIQGKCIVSDQVYLSEPVLRNKFINRLESGEVEYAITPNSLGEAKARDISAIIASREILANTARRAAFFGCYGHHEWAMLYSGGGANVSGHQTLPLRVSQSTIDRVVEGGVRCTHFDAFRFFQPEARKFNVIDPISRSMQSTLEQPGCLHANMDLFKHAYTLFPLVDGALLRECLQLAIAARKIDMRASPYDVSSVEGCEVPLCVEDADGRRAYALEQESLAIEAAPLRQRLLDAYDAALEGVDFTSR